MSTEEKKSSLPRTLLIVAAAAVAGFAAVYVVFGPGGNGGRVSEVKETQGDRTDVARQGLAALAVGDMSTFVVKKTPVPVPDFTFKDGEGKDRTPADWKGKVVLLNLWATWCAPCRKEMPDLNKLQVDLGGDAFEVVAVSIDKTDPEKPRAFLEQIKATDLNFYHDPTGRFGTTLKAYGLPTTLLINREGMEVGRLAGPAHWGSEDAVNLIRAALEDKN